ncbi:MAG: hypothetical protein WBB28_00955 [Crinalium sp.]
MTIQSEIIIKVPLEIAESYHRASPEDKEKLHQQFVNLISSSLHFTIREEKKDRLTELMDEIGQKAVERGLTPEILASILNDNE